MGDVDANEFCSVFVSKEHHVFFCVFWGVRKRMIFGFRFSELSRIARIRTRICAYMPIHKRTTRDNQFENILQLIFTHFYFSLVIANLK